MVALNSLLLIIGFVILIKGADWLVAGASSIAKSFNISNLTIGLTIVAFGTSMPEMVVNLVASTTGKNDAAFGNIIGSNNFNLLMILGVSGMIYPLVVQKKTIAWEIPLSLVITAILYVLVNDQLIHNAATNELSRWEGFVLLLTFAGFLSYIYQSMKSTVADNGPVTVRIYSHPKSVGLIVLGLVMLIGGGKLAVDNAVEIARFFGLSEKLIGLTILAVGTSLPELATSAVAAYRKNTDIAIGNVVGSNIFNIALILGVNAVISPVPFNQELNFDLYVLGFGTLAMLLFMFTMNRRKLDRIEATLLFIGYIAYTIYLVTLDLKT